MTNDTHDATATPSVPVGAYMRAYIHPIPVPATPNTLRKPIDRGRTRSSPSLASTASSSTSSLPRYMLPTASSRGSPRTPATHSPAPGSPAASATGISTPENSSPTSLPRYMQPPTPSPRYGQRASSSTNTSPSPNPPRRATDEQARRERERERERERARETQAAQARRDAEAHAHARAKRDTYGYQLGTDAAPARPRTSLAEDQARMRTRTLSGSSSGHGHGQSPAGSRMPSRTRQTQPPMPASPYVPSGPSVRNNANSTPYSSSPPTPNPQNPHHIHGYQHPPPYTQTQSVGNATNIITSNNTNTNTSHTTNDMTSAIVPFPNAAPSHTSTSNSQSNPNTQNSPPPTGHQPGGVSSPPSPPAPGPTTSTPTCIPRRPSLASPAPATPIIPSHLPRPAVRAGAPAPLNISSANASMPGTAFAASNAQAEGAGSNVRYLHAHGGHHATGSLSSPRQLSHGQPPSPAAMGAGPGHGHGHGPGHGHGHGHGNGHSQSVSAAVAAGPNHTHTFTTHGYGLSSTMNHAHTQSSSASHNQPNSHVHNPPSNFIHNQNNNFIHNSSGNLIHKQSYEHRNAQNDSPKPSNHNTTANVAAGPMMQRLLAKPAPVSPARHSTFASVSGPLSGHAHAPGGMGSGSESGGQVHPYAYGSWRRATHGPGPRMRLRSESPRRYTAAAAPANTDASLSSGSALRRGTREVRTDGEGEKKRERERERLLGRTKEEAGRGKDRQSPGRDGYAAGIEFDMDMEDLNRGIASLGAEVGKDRESGRWVPQVGKESEKEKDKGRDKGKDKEKEPKEKKLRNVLRRRPSTTPAVALSTSSSPAQAKGSPASSKSSLVHPPPVPMQPSMSSTPVLTPTRAVHSQPPPPSHHHQQQNSTSPSSSPPPAYVHIPPLGPFSPLSVPTPTAALGVVGMALDAPTASPDPPSKHEVFNGPDQKGMAPKEQRAKTVHRSASASAVMPRSGSVSPLPPRLPTTRAPSSPVVSAPRSSNTYVHPSVRPAGARSPSSSSSLGSVSVPSVAIAVAVPGARAKPTRSASASAGTIQLDVPSPLVSTNSQQVKGGVGPAKPALSPRTVPPSPTPSLGRRATATGSTSAGASGNKATPAKEVVEAYQRQERARQEEKRRVEKEKERVGTLTSTKIPSPTKSTSTRPDRVRRHSVAGLGMALGLGHGLGRVVEEHQRPRKDSTMTLDTLASTQTAESGVRQRMLLDDDGTADNGGGFRLLEKTLGGANITRASTFRKPAPTGVGQSEEAGENGDATPYYTVLGTAETRPANSLDVVWAAPGRWEVDVLGQRMTVAGGGIAPGKEKEKEERKTQGLGKTLSRKVSGRWRKHGGAVVGTVVEGFTTSIGVESRASMNDHRRQEGVQFPEGHRRVHARRHATEGPGDEGSYQVQQQEKMHNRRSLRLSIDKFSDFVDAQPPVPSFAKHTAARAAAAAVVSTNTNVEDRERREEKERKAEKLKKVEASPTGSAGSGSTSKFWKLMRRISVGGLKEKYNESNTAPPPVPALPKDLQGGFSPLHASTSNESAHRTNIYHTEKPKGLRATSASPVPRALGVLRHRKSATAVVSLAHSDAAAASTPPRRSITTVSSSPVSSDMASSKFFQMPHSSRSSSSSFGEEGKAPPLPALTVKDITQHILPPSEITKDYFDTRGSPVSQMRAPSASSRRSQFMADGEDWTIAPSPAVELPSLPIPPPRRPQTAPALAGEFNSGGKQAASPKEDIAIDIDRAESPTIPSFSTTAAVNAFPTRRLSSALSARSRSSPNSPYATSPASALTPASALPPASASPLPSASVLSLPSAGSSSGPPPRPLRSAQRPIPVSALTPTFGEQLRPRAAQVQPPVIADDLDLDFARGRRSESHVRRRSSMRSSTGTVTAVRPSMRRRSSSFGRSASVDGGASGGTRGSMRSNVRRSRSRSGSRSRSISPPLSLAPSFVTTATASTTITSSTMLGADGAGRIVFRELGPARPVLSEREKAARWDDLLERSARAGGTLHLAGASRVLPSDRMRTRR